MAQSVSIETGLSAQYPFEVHATYLAAGHSVTHVRYFASKSGARACAKRLQAGKAR